MSVTAEIITIGDEILYGQTLDTNSHWISGELDENNVRVVRKSTISDHEAQIMNALGEAKERADLILITGGLGPTNDDLTKPCLAKYFGVDMDINDEALEDVKALFERAGRKMTDLNRRQALMPLGAEKLTNELGTAPGIWMEQDGKVFVAMPGVPHEMKGLMSKEVLPRIREKFVKKKIYHRIVRTGGIPESHLAETLKDWEDNLPEHIKLAYLPSLAQVKLRLTAEGEDLATLKKETLDQIQKCLPLIQKYVFATENIELEERVGQMLRERGLKIACAESCTGGYLSHLLTSIPGSSDYFNGSYVAYSYEIKEKALSVDRDILETKGAVSEEVVVQMAENIRKVFNTDIGVSLSGIAGPGGGTKDKPVGTVWIAVSDRNGTKARKYVFAKDRLLNIRLSAMVALNMVRRRLSKLYESEPEKV